MKNFLLHNQRPCIRAVLFDAYGTLVGIGDKRAPFRQLLRIGERQGRRPSVADAATLMTSPMGLVDAAQVLGIRLTADDAARLDSDLQAEIASICLFPDTLMTLRELRRRGFRLGLCSNLAAAYAEPMMRLLWSELDAFVWSFQARAIKPDPSIYAQSCQALDCAPDQVLMIGDTREADVDGPRAYGMRSTLLDHIRHVLADESLAPWFDLLKFLNSPKAADRLAPT